MTNSSPPPSSPNPTPKGIWISGLALGLLVGLVPWAIGQFIPKDEGSDLPTESQGFTTSVSQSNQAINAQSPTRQANQSVPGPGQVQAPSTPSTPGSTQLPTSTPPSGGTQTPGTSTSSSGGTQNPSAGSGQGSTQVPTSSSSSGGTQTPSAGSGQSSTSAPSSTGQSSTGKSSKTSGETKQPIRGLW